MKGLDKNKGITLVALVVTIIVLIILAGVSISLVLGQDGVVQKAKAGRDNYAEAARLENEQLANVDAFAMDIEAMIPSSPSESQGTITNMTGGDLEISATVSLSANTNLERTKYVFTTSSSALGTNDESLYKDGIVEQANGTVKATKKAGTYYLHVLATDTNGGKTEIISEQTATSEGKKDFNYTGNVQNITLEPGNYKLEVWGAQGGGHTSYPGGKGGYSEGKINITSSQQLFVYVGGEGNYNITNTMQNGGYNGGGNGYSDSSGLSTHCVASSGGGATDISIIGGECTLSNYRYIRTSDSYLSRIIVAGGGGGSNYGTSGYTGGPGGGTNGIINGTGSTGSNGGGGGATQTSIGTSSSWCSSRNSSGAFGYGSGANTGGVYEGGGGGWYGGGSGVAAGGGGSGYIYTSSTASNYPSGCKLNSSYYLTDAQTTAGNTSFTSPTGSNETGHSGNGYARITALD